jgi:hypothetical protein
VPGKVDPITINGLTITVELAVRLRRVTQKNTVKNGGMMLRYAKNKPLSPAVGAWQSAFLYGCLRDTTDSEASTPEAKLCLTLDEWGGKLYQAPTDSVSRFSNMKAACATIAERWDNIQPPPNAVYSPILRLYPPRTRGDITQPIEIQTIFRP